MRHAVGDHLGHELVCPVFDAFGARDHRRARGQRRTQHAGGGAQVLRGNGKQDRIIAADSFGCGCDSDTLVKFHTGEGGALASRLQPVGTVLVTSRKQYRAPARAITFASAEPQAPAPTTAI